LTFFLEDNSEF